MKVKQFHTKNQFLITGVPATQSFDGISMKSGERFQSYDSTICHKTFDGKVYLDRNTWNYSMTTGRYRNLFLGETKRETEARIKTGEYILVDLN